MDWHRTPKDDAWKEAHLGMLAKLDMGLMLRCEGCNHKVIEDPRLFAARHNLDLPTAMLTPIDSSGRSKWLHWRN